MEIEAEIDLGDPVLADPGEADGVQFLASRLSFNIFFGQY